MPELKVRLRALSNSEEFTTCLTRRDGWVVGRKVGPSVPVVLQPIGDPDGLGEHHVLAGDVLVIPRGKVR